MRRWFIGAFFVGLVLSLFAHSIYRRVRDRLDDRELPAKTEALWNEELDRLKKTPSSDPSVIKALESLQMVVSGKINIDPHCGGACTKFCTDDPSAVDICSLSIDPQIFRMAMKNSDDPMARKAIMGLLIKEGETIRYLRDDPPMEYEAVLLENYFNALRKGKSFSNQLHIEVGGRSVAPDMDIVAKILLCKWVEMESDGYFVTIRYFSKEGLTSTQFKNALDRAHDSTSQELYRRIYNLMKAAETAPDQRELAVRTNVMNQEVLGAHAAASMWVSDQLAEESGGWAKYHRKPEDFAFLLNRDLINAHVAQYAIQPN